MHVVVVLILLSGNVPKLLYRLLDYLVKIARLNDHYSVVVCILFLKIVSGYYYYFTNVFNIPNLYAHNVRV